MFQQPEPPDPQVVEELAGKIREQIGDVKVHVFMKGTPSFPQCGFSKTVCDVFGHLGVEFGATNVLEDLPTYRAALQQVTDWPTIPQVFVDGEFVGGCDITVEMFQSGELQKLLGVGEAKEAAQEASS